MSNHHAYRQEAELFGKYLLGKPPDDFATGQYVQAMEKLNIASRGKDEKLLRFALKYPGATGLVDAGTALFMRHSALRRKLVVMFAILESTPAYSDLFLPRKTSLIYPLYIFWSGCRAVLKALFGGLIIKLI